MDLSLFSVHMVFVEIDLDEHAGKLDWRVIAPRVSDKPKVEVQRSIVTTSLSEFHGQIQPRSKDDGSDADSDEGGNRKDQNKGPKRGIFDHIISKWSGLASDSLIGDEVFKDSVTELSYASIFAFRLCIPSCMILK